MSDKNEEDAYGKINCIMVITHLNVFLYLPVLGALPHAKYGYFILKERRNALCTEILIILQNCKMENSKKWYQCLSRKTAIMLALTSVLALQNSSMFNTFMNLRFSEILRCENYRCQAIINHF